MYKFLFFLPFVSGCIFFDSSAPPSILDQDVRSDAISPTDIGLTPDLSVTIDVKNDPNLDDIFPDLRACDENFVRVNDQCTPQLVTHFAAIQKNTTHPLAGFQHPEFIVPFMTMSSTAGQQVAQYSHVDIAIDGSSKAISLSTGEGTPTGIAQINLVEFNPAYFNVYKGEFKIDQGMFAVTIQNSGKTIDPKRAFLVFYSNISSPNETKQDSAMVMGQIEPNSTFYFSRGGKTISGHKKGKTGTVKGHYYVVEAKNISGKYAIQVEHTFQSAIKNGSGKTTIAITRNQVNRPKLLLWSNRATGAEIPRARTTCGPSADTQNILCQHSDFGIMSQNNLLIATQFITFFTQQFEIKTKAFAPNGTLTQNISSTFPHYKPTFALSGQMGVAGAVFVPSGSYSEPGLVSVLYTPDNSTLYLSTSMTSSYVSNYQFMKLNP